MNTKKFDVVIVGAGVSGAAVARIIAEYTNVEQMLVLEKYAQPGEVNSHPMNNAQTSHDGGTETNYSLSHALEVKEAAVMLRRYIETKNDPLLSQKRLRMVLAVGEDEVSELKARFKEFSPHYPDLFLVDAFWLAANEPKVMEERDPDEPVCAMVSREGYIVNYQQLARTCLSDAMRANALLEVCFNTGVKTIRKEGGEFIIDTDKGTRFTARMVIFCAGAHSLYYAHMLGYGLDYAILPVAGSFYSGGKLLRSKVYRMQIPGLPFAAVHGDPDILNMHETRFGPTTKPLPVMERHRYNTAPALLKIYARSPLRGISSLVCIIASKQLFMYVIENLLYDLPFVGKVLFARKVRPIIPSIRAKELKLRRGAGGIRPQIINLKTGALEMGNKTIEGEGCLFVTTPSPGASVCLWNAKHVVVRAMEFLGASFAFDKDRFDRDHS